MKKRLTAIVAIALSLGILFAGCGGGGEEYQHPLIGQPAPDFQFQVSGEQPLSLSNLQGSPVLLNFWAIRCPPCREEMPFLQQIYEGWQGTGLVLLAVNLQESPSDVEGFMQSQGFSFPVLLDSGGELAGQYGVHAIPTTFFINGEGIIQEVKVGAFQSAAAIEDSLDRLISVPSD
jgi:peroxiredoxin